MALGASDLLTAVIDAFKRPAVGFGIEAVLGLVLIAFAGRKPRPEASAPAVRGTSLTAAFLTGVTVTAIESTTALPYIGALTALVRADVPLGQTMIALLAYNFVFVLPPLLLVGLHSTRPGKAGAAVARVRRGLAARPIRALVAVLGLLMSADALYFFVRGEAAF